MTNEESNQENLILASNENHGYDDNENEYENPLQSNHQMEEARKIRFFINDNDPEIRKKIQMRIKNINNNDISFSPEYNHPNYYNNHEGYKTELPNYVHDKPILSSNYINHETMNIPSISQLPLQNEFNDDYRNQSLFQEFKDIFIKSSGKIQEKGLKLMKKFKRFLGKGHEGLTWILDSAGDIKNSIFNNFNDMPLDYENEVGPQGFGSIFPYRRPTNIKETVGWANLQKMSNSLPDLHRAITVMSFVAFSVFVVNLGVNALANVSIS